MTGEPVPLMRHFSPVPKTEDESGEQEIRSIMGGRKRKGWVELEEEYRCVILAEAGAGKTYEMMERAKYSEERGRAAFFIRIEDIDESFEDAFEVGDATIFARWLSSQGDAWFFLDSIDEARLESPKAFEKAIRRFSTRIKNAQQRAHILISSRPYAWRSRSDRALLERHLPFERPKKERFGDVDPVAEQLVGEKSDQPESALQVYLLDALDEDDIRVFAEHRAAPHVDKLIDDLKRANLIDMASRPFDLELILDKWKTDRTLDGRLELLRHNIDQRLIEIDPDRARRQPLNREKARVGARALAAAVILTGKPGIHVPDATHKKTGIDAETVLADWNPEDVHALLERGIFNDVLYGMVRFRHREVRELLAAEWLGEHLSKGNSRLAVEALLFREQYGQKIVTPRLRPLLPWLILFDDEIRRRVLTCNPEIAVEGGDAARLPLAERQALLKDIVQRIVKDEDDRSARDNGAIARIAQADLTDDALRLIAEHENNDEAIFFLGRLVWQGEMAECVPALSEIAASAERGIYARIAASRAVMTCGARDRKDNLWQTLNAASDELPRKLLAEIVEHAEAEASSVASLLDSINKLAPHKRFESTGLSQAIHSFIDRLPVNTSGAGSDPLATFVSGLNDFLSREPHIEQRECRVSEEFAWLLGPATHAVERLVAERADPARQADAMAIMLKVPTTRFRCDTGFDRYKCQLGELVPAWSELNDALFWRSVEDARAHIDAMKGERLTDDRRVQWIGHYWKFDLSGFERVLDFIRTRTLEDDRLIATSLAHRIWMQSEKPAGQLAALRKVTGLSEVVDGRLDELLNAPASEEARKWQKEGEKWKRKCEKREKKEAELRTEWIESLKSNPDIVRKPPGLQPGEFSNHQYRLLEEIESDGLGMNRRDGSNWRALIEEFGEDVAQAYRDATVAHWQNFTPDLRSEGYDASTIPLSLVFAMAGLEIEAREVVGFPDHLSEQEIRHALRYTTWEPNGFPAWLETAYRARPDLVLEAIMKEARWELANADPEKPINYILHDLVYYAPWIHGALVDPILDWLETNEVWNYDTLCHSLQLLTDGADPARLAELARNKVGADSEETHLPTWYALWVDSDAESGIPAVEQWLGSQQEELASRSAQLFVTTLMGGRRHSRIGIGSFRTAQHLKALYVLIHQFVRAKDDIERAGKGVYSPELRDDAQDARNGLFNLLSEIPGKEAYVALSELIRGHPDPDYRSWMAKRAYKRAEEDGDLEPWSTDQVQEFDQVRTRTPATNRQLYDLSVSRLNDLKNWLERGNDSPYRTWQRATSETEMRNLVAGWLNTQSGSRYNCAQENELPNKQRPDIWIQNSSVSSPVPIELKLLDQPWSGPKLCERLCNQLAGDYLREETASCGVMLLIWRGRTANRRWRIGGKRVGVSELAAALKRYWNDISDEFPNIEAIDVVVIDLTLRGKVIG